MAIDRLHIFGASGSGTSTLGAAIAKRFGHAHLDVDTYFWMPSDPPFQHQREPEERRRLLGAALAEHRRWVLTGSLCRWGDVFIPQFQLAVFLYVPHDIRMARILQRERERYSAEIELGGRMHQASQAFLAWADAYDTADDSMRSLVLHEKWIATLGCRCIRLEGDLTIDEQMSRLDESLA